MDQESIIWFENYKRLMMDKRFLSNGGCAQICINVRTESLPLRFCCRAADPEDKGGGYIVLYYVPSLIGGSVAVVLV